MSQSLSGQQQGGRASEVIKAIRKLPPTACLLCGGQGNAGRIKVGDLGELGGSWLRERKDSEEERGVQVRLLLLQHIVGINSC